MSVVHSEDSAYMQEMQRWEGHKYFGDLPPGRPYQYREFPHRLYKAGRNAHGQTAILEAQTANDEREASNLESRGFVMGGQDKAIEAFERQELEIAKLAAERNFEMTRMSEGARREVAQVEASAGARHIAEIPRTPVKRKSSWDTRRANAAARKAAEVTP